MAEADLASAIRDQGCTSGCGMRRDVDFAVSPDTTWHVGVDSATTYDPDDLLWFQCLSVAPPLRITSRAAASSRRSMTLPAPVR